MSREATASQRVREHFTTHAASFESIYRHAGLQRVLRRSLNDRQEAALTQLRRFEQPSLLDVGCGTARLASEALLKGIRLSRYVGVDFSAPMLDLAQARLRELEPLDNELHHADFLDLDLADERFDVITGLGLFDYLDSPHAMVRKMRAHCLGCVTATFPRWTWVRGPYRFVRYRLHDCPIFNYTRREIEYLFLAAGFERVEFVKESYVYIAVASV